MDFVFWFLAFISAADALRDRWSLRSPGVGWWQWHAVKWLGFYSATGYIFFAQGYDAVRACETIIFCTAVWLTVYWYRRV